MSEENVPNIQNIINFLDAAQRKVEEEAVPEKTKERLEGLGDRLTDAIVAMSKEDIHRLSVGISMAACSLYARRKMRLALVELGFSPKAAKAITVGLIWGAFSIAGNAATGVNYSNFVSDNNLYPDKPEESN